MQLLFVFGIHPEAEVFTVKNKNLGQIHLRRFLLRPCLPEGRVTLALGLTLFFGDPKGKTWP
jgi:hypothetical protein